ncbi:MAG: hypothetical protein IJ072_05870, partial [Oscillospiraceae bacterium]|nr:hypothetical protein [Oscillospiraceae bacterium]
MFKKAKERLSVFAVKNPAQTILIAILVLNLILFAVSALVISALAPKSLEHSGFWASVFYTISMILDAGCIQFVIMEIGEASVALIIVCLLTVLVGMITFTGAVVGYVTNYISGFIENSKSGVRALKVSGHTVILNWNSRASEIINDLLYTGERELVVILVSDNAAAVEREINERISASLKADHQLLLEQSADMPLLRALAYRRKHRTRNRVTVIVREGETYSTKQLNDLSLSQANTVILLSKDYKSSICKFGSEELRQEREKGNANTVKTLVQVAEMTAGESSADDQIIIVEVEDHWTGALVNRIIAHKERLGKCRIIPVSVNKILGQILSQFSIMPELNTVYSELFSNRGAEFFFSSAQGSEDADSAVERYMLTHDHAIALTTMDATTGRYAYYMANSVSDCRKTAPAQPEGCAVEINEGYFLKRRNIVIVGHNSKSADIMNGFSAFRGEHNLPGGEVLNITVIDDKKNLERLDNYSAYPYVTKVVPASVYDAATIRGAIEEAVDSHEGDTSILILSDDSAAQEDTDSAALTYLIYVQDIIFQRMNADPHFDRESIDVVVEILNPKNYDVVHNYSVDNVVISNRYISKMVTQIGRKQALF